MESYGFGVIGAVSTVSGFVNICDIGMTTGRHLEFRILSLTLIIDTMCSRSSGSGLRLPVALSLVRRNYSCDGPRLIWVGDAGLCIRKEGCDSRKRSPAGRKTCPTSRACRRLGLLLVMANSRCCPGLLNLGPPFIFLLAIAEIDPRSREDVTSGRYKRAWRR